MKCRPIFIVAGKATFQWPGLPQNPDQAYQTFPGHAFLASLAWPGLAGLAMLLTALLMQGKLNIDAGKLVLAMFLN